MGYGKLTKSLMDTTPQKTLTANEWQAKIAAKRAELKGKPKPDYNYVEDAYQKGSVRRELRNKQANEIADSKTLTEDQKTEQLFRMQKEEELHQNTFRKDTERKQHLRDRLLGKQTDEEMAKKYDKYTDGYWYTKK